MRWPCWPQNFAPGTESISLRECDTEGGRRWGGLGVRYTSRHLPIYLPAWQPACLPFLGSSIYLSANLSFCLSSHLSPVSLCVRAAHSPPSLAHLPAESKRVCSLGGPFLPPAAGTTPPVSGNWRWPCRLVTGRQRHWLPGILQSRSKTNIIHNHGDGRPLPTPSCTRQMSSEHLTCAKRCD